MSEEWARIPSFPSYEASSLGRVRRVVAYVSTHVGRVIVPQPRKSGYLTVGLSECGKVTRAYVHRVVCAAFHGVPENDDLQAAHLDGTRDNNHSDNLAWVTAAENEAHKKRHGTAPLGKPKVKGRKIADEVVDEIRRRHIAGEMQSDIAASVGVSKTYVHKIVHKSARAYL